MAIGVTFCLITGGVDFVNRYRNVSVTSLIGAFLVAHKGLPVWVGLLVCVLCGIVMGFFNGFLVAVMNLPPFIATLCSMMITRGLGSLITGGLSVAWPASSTPEGAFRNLFKLNVGGTIIPIGLIFVLAAAVIMSIVLNKTRPGRYIIAVGSNKEALRLSGVNVVKWQWLAYVISGIFTGLAAVCLCRSSFFICSSWRWSRTGDGCYLWSDYRWNFHERWFRNYFRNSSRCICYGTVENWTSFCRIPG